MTDSIFIIFLIVSGRLSCSETRIRVPLPIRVTVNLYCKLLVVRSPTLLNSKWSYSVQFSVWFEYTRILIKVALLGNCEAKSKKKILINLITNMIKKWRKTMIKKNILVINYLLIKKNEERPWFNYTLAKDDFFSFVRCMQSYKITSSGLEIKRDGNKDKKKGLKLL